MLEAEVVIKLLTSNNWLFKAKTNMTMFSYEYQPSMTPARRNPHGWMGMRQWDQNTSRRASKQKILKRWLNHPATVWHNQANNNKTHQDLILSAQLSPNPSLHDLQRTTVRIHLCNRSCPLPIIIKRHLQITYTFCIRHNNWYCCHIFIPNLRKFLYIK